MKQSIVPLNIQFRELNEYIDLRSQIRPILQHALPGDYFLTEVALNEAVNNAMIHGCRNEGGTIRLKVKVTERKLIIRVKNEGEGFPANDVLKQIRDSADNPFEKRLHDESGRGLPIMDAAFDCMFFNRQGTEVMLIKEITR